LDHNKKKYAEYKLSESVPLYKYSPYVIMSVSVAFYHAQIKMSLNFCCVVVTMNTQTHQTKNY